MPEQRLERLGIMGGTFDPIHFGHLVAAEAAREAFGLDRVIFVPTGTPPHKTRQKITDGKHRYLMTVLATLSNPHFEVSRIELDKTGLTYTVDTVRELKQETGSELFFITGADAVREICSWREPTGIFEFCSIIAATRPGYDLKDLRVVNDTLGEDYRNCIYTLEVPALSISSSEVRSRVRSGKSIKYLVPEQVEHYILKNGLYRAASEF